MGFLSQNAPPPGVFTKISTPAPTQFLLLCYSSQEKDNGGLSSGKKAIFKKDVAEKRLR